MDLPVMPPVQPMLAKAMTWEQLGAVAGDRDYRYEPKWDGFRCLVFRDGAEVELGSRSGKSLTRYFPDVVEAVRAHLPPRCVVDGEVVIAGAGGLDFELLSQRIHPASSRVELLARQTPASYVAFDLLALGDDDLRRRPFAERRSRLEAALAAAGEPIHLTPITADRARAEEWFEHFEGAGLDGVVAKPADLAYLPDKRVMVKVKHERTGDFVVGGFRWYQKDRDLVGSLMLGLYDGGDLHPVGVIGAFPAERRRAMVDELAPYRAGAETGHPWARWSDFMVADGGRAPGGGNRWNAKKDMSFELLRPELVVEAAFEHLQGRRLRHTARFRRWRLDRAAASCTYDQLDVAVPALLADLFAAGRG